MKNILSHFKFQKNERNGIFFLLAIIIVVQVLYFTVNFKGNEPAYNEEASLMLQKLADSIMLADSGKSDYREQPFNPNYITDYKGYKLGMSIEEIDRLLAFRKTGKFVNSVEEFQEVTQVSDSLLNAIYPFFKFPEWTQKKQGSVTSKVNAQNNTVPQTVMKEKVIVKTDINKVTKEQLIAIYGIGPTYAERIIAYRNKLGGFSLDDQLYEVWGINTEAIQELLKYYTVQEPPVIEKQNLNMISLSKLAKSPYLNYTIAKSIVKYRSSRGNIANFEELLKVEEVTEQLVKRLPLYFYLEN